jgi:hypothetical protein
MAIQVSLDIEDLNTAGVFGLAEIGLQGVDLGKCDWALTGPVIEQRGISLRYRPITGPNDVRAILGSRDEWDASVDQPTTESVSGQSPHHVVAKLIVKLAMTNESVALPLDRATQWLESDWLLVDILTTPSAHHEVTKLDNNHFLLTANDNDDDRDHFANLVDVAKSIDGDLLNRLDVTMDAVSNSATAIQFWLI